MHLASSIMEIFLQWTPIVDGVDLTDQPLNLIAKGVVAPIPMIIVSSFEVISIVVVLLSDIECNPKCMCFNYTANKSW